MSITRLLIARHGNTFSETDILCRVGAETDIPLVESGRRQGRLLGQFLAKENLLPDLVYSSRLKRAVETATLALAEMPLPAPLTLRQDDIFNEIDYGIDEGKPEDEVIARLGADALKAWDQNAVVPEGWKVDPQALIQNWLDFGAEIAQKHAGKTVLVVTSNGIARFAPYLTGNFDGFKAQHNIKLSTGAVSRLDYDGKNWQTVFWNTRPEKRLEAA